MGGAGGNDDMPDEFSLIERLFAPLAGPGAFSLTDDAAVLTPRPGFDLVLTKDAIAEGRHYLPGDPPGDVARKLLRVNLSDLAAKGAQAKGYLLACAWGEAVSFGWMEGFAKGLASDQEQYGVTLLGGDTIRTSGPSVFSLTAIGEVASGRMVRRAGARAGDDIYVTGTLGDAALGLMVAKGELSQLDAATRAALVNRYRLPDPPLAFGSRLAEVASAALDVSDGLMADLQHLCETSEVGAVLEKDSIPLSAASRSAVENDPALWQRVFGGGDDYQILFAASPSKAGEIGTLSGETGICVTRIGRAAADRQVFVIDASGQTVDIEVRGFSHF